MLNIRNESPRHRRLVTTSKDGATNWSKPQFDDTLVDPICMASMIRSGDTLIFSNPAGDGRTKARTHLTLRLSPDSGVTWPHHRVLDEGIAAYSDLALTTEGELLCLYEHGGVDGRATNTATLRLTTLDVSWIK
jgi:sialidase-1